MIRHQQFVLGPVPRNLAWAMVVVGAVAAAVGVAADPQRTWPDLLLNGFYTMGLALAGMVFISFQYLSGATWSANMRRVPEALMSALPIAGVLMLTLFFGREWLYPASRPGADTADPAKALYLGAPFFFGRMALFVVVWTVFARLMRRSSLRQDEDPTPIHHHRLVRYSAAFIVVFSISFSLASFDWLMTLTPHWSSTMFAVYAFAGVLVGGMAAITLCLVLLGERGYLVGVVNENHLHDCGKLLFTFSTFWAYIWFSQYLLIWYGNLPEETTYYVSRTGESWIVLFLLNVVVNWVIPFLVLMPRSSKRNPAILKWIAIIILAGRWLDLYLAVMPETRATPSVGPLDVLIVGGYAASFFLMATRALASAPLVPLNNPSFHESLAHRQ
ncbi:MAG: hypothetical protein AUF76_06845 [Acidobacteria bacterium 13_1_20CM_2_65_9]|nr:MAG: hypothetical protein AUF76_06845 [Acidobacteria bacterium 13_1_20CM_2_65_9]